MTITEKLARHVNNIRFDNMSAKAVDMTKNCFIDLMGCVIAGVFTPESKPIIEVMFNNNSNLLSQNKMEVSKSATIPGIWKKTTPLEAAMINAYCGHIYEMDDDLDYLHPAIPVIPPALATAESIGKSGKDLIEAIATGYEMETWIAKPTGNYHYYFWHTTSTCGPFGSAAATGKLLGLSETQMVWAMGNAGSQSAGLWQFIYDNAMTKYLHCGKAAYNGMLAALLAEQGYTGAKAILEGERGFYKATCDVKNPESYFDTVGQEELKIVKTGFKLWPNCRHTHSSLNAALNLRNKYHFDPQKIEKIQIETYKTATLIAKNMEYTDSRSAKFSLTYAVALALYTGKVDIDNFDKYLYDQKVKELAAKIEVIASEELNDLYLKGATLPGKVSVMYEGNIYCEQLNNPKGDMEYPLTNQEINDKFMDMACRAISRKQAAELLAIMRNLEQVENVANMFNDYCPRGNFYND